MTGKVFDVVVIGVPEAVEMLAAHGITDVAHLPDGTTVVDSTFDESGHTWSVRTITNRTVVARIMLSDTVSRGEPAPYLGVAVAGEPNCFTVCGTGRVRSARLGYVLTCLHLMARSAATRIELRRGVHPDGGERTGRWFWRRMARRAASVFDLSSDVAVTDDVYDGRATLDFDGDERTVRVRLCGHLDPIDGHYHWRGTVFGELPVDVLKRSRPVTLRTDVCSAEGRITERTPQGGYSVAGVGAPPFALDDVEPVNR